MRKMFLLSVLWVFCAGKVSAQRERNLLTGAYTQELLDKDLSLAAIKAAYPAYSNRQQWEAIDPAYRKELIRQGEEELTYQYQTIPATTYLEYVKTGNRYIMEDVYNRNMTAIKKLVFAELAEGKERFIPQIINGVWAVCEITSWSISASINLQRKNGKGLPDVQEPVVELGAGITCNVLAWTYYLFHDTFDKYSPLIAQRLKYEIDRRILQPYYTRNDFWWMALSGKPGLVNNWNVWLNYNVLTCLLLVEDDKEKRAAGVYKTMRSVDQFINYYKDDGGCEEGPAYWSHAGGMLYNYLSLLQQATGGSINIFEQPLIRNVGAYISKAYIDSTWFLNYADAAAKLQANAGLVYYFGKAVHDTTLTSFGAYLARQQQWEQMVPVETLYDGIRNIFQANSILHTRPRQPLMAQAWMPGTGIAMARDEEGSAKGFYFSALAGHNAESHNHNDVGTCVLFYDGQPLLIDIGCETYTRQTFGPERYSIWTMRSAYHNVPLINGTEQKEGRQYAARNVSFNNSASTAIFRLDIAAAYPKQAAVEKWERTYQLKRRQSFSITDHYKLLADTGSTALHFMTSAAVQKIKEGTLRMTIGAVKMDMQYDAAKFEATIEPVEITDKRLLQSWPPVVYRLVLKLRQQAREGSHTLLFKKAP